MVEDIDEALRYAAQVLRERVAITLLAASRAVMLLPSAIVVSPFVGLVEQNDDHEHRGGRMLLRPAVGATRLLAP